jgi:hypothetical protein
LALLSASYYHKQKTFFSLGKLLEIIERREINTRIRGKKNDGVVKGVSTKKGKNENAVEKTGDAIGKDLKKGAKVANAFGKGLKKGLKKK